MGCRKIKTMSYYFHKLDKPSLSTAKNHGRIKKWSKSPWKHKINVFIHNRCRSAASWTGPWRWTTSRWTPSTGSGTTTCWPTSSTGQHQHQPVMVIPCHGFLLNICLHCVELYRHHSSSRWYHSPKFLFLFRSGLSR